MAELIDLISSNFDYENFFSAKLTADMTAGDTDVFLDNIPASTEGVLVIDWDVAASREVVFFNSKTGAKVTCPVDGRGFDNTTATTHQSGANVIMAPVRAYFRLVQQLATTSEQGWKPLGYTPNTVTANGNRSYDLVFNSVDLTSYISPGQRLELTRTTTAPTNSFSLDGVNDYYNRSTTINGCTFTDDFSMSAWVYLTSYTGGAVTIAERFNGSSGFLFYIDSTGCPAMRGYNGGASNYRGVKAYSSIPLNRWVHIAAQEDMSTHSVGATNCYIMIDGKEVPSFVETSGTNPTTLVQAGNITIGATQTPGQYFPGYLDQVAIYSAKVTQATHLAAMNQKLSGSETSLVSAYSNGSTTDLNTTNANNLTAQGGATTAVKSPFATNGSSVSLGTKDYALVMKTSFSTNTTLTVQVPEGCTIPTTGGISAVSYGIGNPYAWVADKARWEIGSYYGRIIDKAAPGTSWGIFTQSPGITVPVGSFYIEYNSWIGAYKAAAVQVDAQITLSTSTSAETDKRFTTSTRTDGASSTIAIFEMVSRGAAVALTAQQSYNILVKSSLSASAAYFHYASGTPETMAMITATPTGL